MEKFEGIEFEHSILTDEEIESELNFLNKLSNEVKAGNITSYEDSWKLSPTASQKSENSSISDEDIARFRRKHKFEQEIAAGVPNKLIKERKVC